MKRRVPRPYCRRCHGPKPCLPCRERPRAFVMVRGTWLYESVKADVTAKDAGRDLTALHERMGREMADYYSQDLDGWRVQVVVHVPTDPARAHRRGFDQAENIARAVSARLELPHQGLLTRAANIPPQRGNDITERFENMAGAYKAAPTAYNRILLIDDVIGTAATMDAAARAINSEVYGLAYAKTRPPKAQLAKQEDRL